MSWLNDIQLFLGDEEVQEEPATQRQMDFIDLLLTKDEAMPFYSELAAASTNIFLTIGEASELIGRVMEHFEELFIRDGHRTLGDPSPFLNSGTRQKDIVSRVEYLADLDNT